MTLSRVELAGLIFGSAIMGAAIALSVLDFMDLVSGRVSRYALQLATAIDVLIAVGLRALRRRVARD